MKEAARHVLILPQKGGLAYGKKEQKGYFREKTEQL